MESAAVSSSGAHLLIANEAALQRALHAQAQIVLIMRDLVMGERELTHFSVLWVVLGVTIGLW